MKSISTISFRSFNRHLNIFAQYLTLNPLTTDDQCTRHANLAACYKLAQPVLKIGFALAKKVGLGKVGGIQHRVLCTWQLPWLAVEKPWSALAWAFLFFLTQTGVDKAPLPF